jgi:site-specific DNA-methyltransferase (adenine-specific)
MGGIMEIESITNKIINADCMDILKQLPDKSIDAIICDLPYGTTACSWDSIIPFDKLWEQYKRIRKDNTPIVLFGSEPFSSLLRCSNLKEYKYDWIWNKISGGNVLITKYQPLKTHENISVFCKEKCNYYPILEYGYESRINEKPTIKSSDMFSGIKSNKFFKTDKNKPADARYPKSIITYSKQSSECCNSQSIHPTQKPVALIEYLIKTYSNEGDLILDNCSGSGTTAVACHNLKRRFICIEKDYDYWKASVERLENAQAQLRLF